MTKDLEEEIEDFDDDIIIQSQEDLALEKKKKEARELADMMRKTMGKYEPIVVTRDNQIKKATELNKSEQTFEYLKCASDPIYFIETYLTIFDQTQGDGGKIVPFKLFKFQKRLINDYKNKKIRYHVANKYRQAGISTTTCAFIAWYILFNENREVAVVANKLDTAKNELMADVVDFINSCPTWMCPTIIPGKDTQHLKKYSNGCKLGAFSSKGLRGITPTLLFWDEVAHTEKAEKFWLATQPVLSTGGGAIFVSTPSGYDKVFFKTFDNAKKKLNNFNPVELWWFNDPRYNKGLVWIRNKGKDTEIKIIDDDFEDEKRIKLMDDGWYATSPWFEAQVRDANYDMKKISQEILCVKSNTIVNVIDSIGKNIYNITIEKLYNMLENILDKDHDIQTNRLYQILNSSNEYVDFDGLIKSTKNIGYKVTLHDNKEIIVGEDHMFLAGAKSMHVKSLTPDVNYITTIDGDVYIKSIEIVDGGDFYDVVDSMNSEYYGNGILNHNCSFLGSGDNFIAEEYMKRIEDTEIMKPIREEYGDMQMWIWENPIEGEEYLMIIDVSSGHSDDFSSINILKKREFIEDKIVNIKGVAKKIKQKITKLEQVAEYYGRITPQDVGKLALTYGKLYNYAYCIIDVTGGYGSETVSVIIEDGYENIHYAEVKHSATRERLAAYSKTSTKVLSDGTVVDVDLIPGFFIGSNRPNIMLDIQRAIHMQYIIIRSARLHSEMKTIVTVNKPGRIADHRRGFHDDSFMGVAIGIYVVNYDMSNFKNDTNKVKKMIEALSNMNNTAKLGEINKKQRELQQRRNPYGSNAWVMSGFGRR